MNLIRTQSKAISDLATLADLLTLIEDNKLVIYAQLRCEHAIATVREGKEVIGIGEGAFDFKLALEQKHSAMLLAGQKINVNRVPMQAKNFTSWSEGCSLEPHPPLKNLEHWRGSAKTAVQTPVIAIPNPRVEKNISGMMSQLEKAQKNLENGNELLQQFQQVFNQYTDGHSHTLNNEPLSLSIQDTFVDFDSLQATLSTPASTGNDSAPLTSANDIKSLFENLNLKSDNLNALLFRVVNSIESASQSKVWRAIEKDYHAEQKRFDVDDIIIDLSDSELVWRSLHGRATLKYDSLRPRLIEVKKVIAAM